MSKRLHLWLHCLTVLLIFGASTAKSQTCSVNAGVNSSICVTGTMTLFGNATGLFGTPAEWAWVSGPNVPTITSPTSATTTVTGFVPGTYRFRYHGVCSDAVVASDTVEVLVQAVPVFTAGADSFVCGTSRVMNATLPSGATGSWSALPVSGYSAPSFSSGAPNATVTISGTLCPINYTAIYTVTQGSCIARDTVLMSFGGQTISSMSLADVFNICGTSYTYSAAFNFGCGFSFSYVQLTGPSVVTVVNTNASNQTTFTPRISNMVVGNYTIALAITPCTGVIIRDTINLSVTSTTAPTFTGTLSKQLCPIQYDSVYYFDANEFALLPGETLTFNFSSLTKPAASPSFPTIDTIGRILRMRNVVHPDTSTSDVWDYTLNYTVSNGSCFTTNQVRLTLIPPFKKSFQPVINVSCGGTFANVTIPTSGDLTGFRFTSGTVISKPSGSPNPFFLGGGLSSPYFISGLVPGKYVISYYYFKGPSGPFSICGSPISVVEVNVSASGGVANAGTNQVLACGVDSTVLAGNTPPLGQIGTWQLVSGPSSVVLTNPNSPSLLIKSLTLGVYTFRWAINNGITCPGTSDEMQVLVTPTAPNADAGPDRTVCYGYSIPLIGNNPISGTIGRWRQISGPSVTITDSTAAITSITGTIPSSVFTFTWTLSNICGSDTDTVVINTDVSQGPSNANILTADACITAAGFTGTTLNATAPTIGSGLWSQISGPALATIATPASATTTVSGMASLGEYKFEWAVTSAGCDTLRDTVSIANRGTTALTAVAGTDKYLCTDTITMTATTPTLGLGTWTQVMGPFSFIDSVNKATAKVSGLTYGGIYDYVWTVNLGVCSAAIDTVHVVVSTLSSPAVARTDTLVCNFIPPSFNSINLPLRATAPTSGVGAWSIIESTYGNSNINNPELVNSNGNFFPGVTKVLWQVVSGVCPSNYDTVVIEVVPRANAGAATVGLCDQTVYSFLSGTSPGTGTSLWSQISGPTTAGITQPNTQFPTLTNLTTGTYRFRYQITHPISGCSSDDTITFVNSIRPLANAGRDSTFCYSPAGTALFLLADTPTVGTGSWSRLNGSGTLIFSPGSTDNPTNANISAAGTGIQQFQWTVTNGTCQSRDIKDVIIEQLPNPNISFSPLTACRDTFTVTGSAVSNSFNFAWSFPKARVKDTSGIGLTGPITNNFLISDTNSIYLTITNPSSGCTAIDSTSVIVDCAYLPLPLKFLSVQTTVKDCAVQLLWDFNLDGNSKLQQFCIERSADGRSYTNIASLSASTKSYLDIAQGNGRWYYRIKAIGVANEVAYSPTQVVDAKECKGNSVQVYPNPANEQLNIVLQGNSQNNSYELIDALGRVVLSGSLTTNSNNKLDLSGLTIGSYTIRITTDTEVSTEKIQIVQ